MFNWFKGVFSKHPLDFLGSFHFTHTHTRVTHDQFSQKLYIKNHIFFLRKNIINKIHGIFWFFFSLYFEFNNHFIGSIRI